MAAMIPECMLQNMAQPQRNPTAGEKHSLRKTYTPPVRGNAEDNSAHTSAPQSVSAPETAQTRNTTEIAPVRAVISDGWTNIDAPMIVPTTMAVAWTRPMERRNPDAG